MNISPSREELEQLIRHQLRNLFLLQEVELDALSRCIQGAVERVEKCFSYSTNKYYKKGGEVFFYIYHSAQYCIFLYFLSRQVFLTCPVAVSLADKLYLLNKALSGLDLYYEVSMPDIFYLDHPVGSVMGRASYGNHFSFAQHCTVGNNKGVYPEIGEHVRMLSGSKILGKSIIGDNVTLSANSYVKDAAIPANSIVFGSSPNLIIKPKFG